MNFVALLLGLGVERLLTHLFHLREFRWLDPVFDKVLDMLSKYSRGSRGCSASLIFCAADGRAGRIGVICAGRNPVPDARISYWPSVVLLFSLGPRDLKEEVNDYCAAVDDGSADDIQRVARELIER